ncbi:Remorin family protein [Zea mays]|uniref:Remorin family protein n=1 Tax=Zea mays TaxID=4577 RepID=A0A1D6E4R6_MAIZE|nr:Remorin family protein [Zea mays]
MAEEEAKKVEVEVTKEPEAAAKEDVADDKAVIPATDPPPPPPPADDSKALAIVEKVADEPAPEKPAPAKQGGSNDRDLALARVETEKRNSLIKAWEENEKTKAENKNNWKRRRLNMQRR